jgi:antitoxin component of MazEF toxin-antitoxin module
MTEVLIMVKTMRVNKWGDALGIRFPAEVVKEIALKDKSYVEMRTNGDEIIIRRAPELLSLEELIERCPEWDGKPPENYDWGEPQGREIF